MTQQEINNRQDRIKLLELSNRVTNDKLADIERWRKNIKEEERILKKRIEQNNQELAELTSMQDKTNTTAL